MAKLPPDLADIERLAQAARARLPEPFRGLAAPLALRVEDWPAEWMLDAFGIKNAYDLTGLYDGAPLTERSVTDQPVAVGAIWLFRRPILDEWIARGDVDLDDLIAHVFVHELAHHLGWSDADIAALDRWWE